MEKERPGSKHKTKRKHKHRRSVGKSDQETEDSTKNVSGKNVGDQEETPLDLKEASKEVVQDGEKFFDCQDIEDKGTDKTVAYEFEISGVSELIHESTHHASSPCDRGCATLEEEEKITANSEVGKENAAESNVEPMSQLKNCGSVKEKTVYNPYSELNSEIYEEINAEQLSSVQLHPSAPKTSDPSLLYEKITEKDCDKTQEQGEVSEVLTKFRSCEVIQRPRTTLSDEVKSLYDNILVETYSTKVDEVIRDMTSSYVGLELYELLSDYLRAQKKLSSCEESFKGLQSDIKHLEERLWSIDFLEVTMNGYCDDGRSVSASHMYQVATFNKEACQHLEKLLVEVKQLVKESFSLFTYSIQLAKAQINHYFFEKFGHIDSSKLGIQCFKIYPTTDIENCAQHLRLCINILFGFIRKVDGHSDFVKDCQKWTVLCVGLLYRVASIDDYFFILNHVIRSPPGAISKWCSNIVQIPNLPLYPSPPYNEIFSDIALDYVLVFLNVIFNPIPHKASILKFAACGSAQSSRSSLDSEHNQWVIVDSDGEDDPENIADFKEKDIILLLHQVPFENVFQRILLVHATQLGVNYDIECANLTSVFKLIVYASRLVSSLGRCYLNFSSDRYRQLCKYVGRLILHVAQYVSEHVENFIAVNANLTEDEKSRIIDEYGCLMHLTIATLFQGKRMGALQFLSAIPFHLLSSSMVWDVYWMLTGGNFSRILDPEANSDTNGLDTLEFELAGLDQSDSFYLLSTLSNIAIMREKLEPNFVWKVTLHLFQIGFISQVTRETCSKVARDLLGSMTRKYPYLISYLLEAISNKIHTLNNMSMFLLKELALEFWKPSKQDLDILFAWLLNHPFNSIQNTLARFIFKSLNFGYGESGELFLSFELHCELVKVLMLYSEKCKISQASSSLSYSYLQEDCSNWAWEIAELLHLHGFDRRKEGVFQLPEIYEMGSEGPVELDFSIKYLSKCSPFSCFMKTIMTPVGHSVPLMCLEGFKMLNHLNQNQKPEFVVRALFFTLPIFIPCPQELNDSSDFQNLFINLLNTDSSYVKLAKNLIYKESSRAFPEIIGGLIASHILDCDKFGTSMESMFKLWLSILTNLPDWNSHSGILYLLNILAKFSLAIDEFKTFLMDRLFEIYHDLPDQKISGITGFLFNWSSPDVCSVLTSELYDSIPQFYYFILLVEARRENDSGFWQDLNARLLKSNQNLNNAVKKASQAKKFAGSVNFLSIYRWAQLCKALEKEDELNILAWQQFFLRYFYRPYTESSSSVCGTGARFFEGAINSLSFSKLKSKISSLVEHHDNELSKFVTVDFDEQLPENPAIHRSFLENKHTLFKAMGLWLSEKDLLSDTHYTLALPPHYLPEKLVELMSGSDIPWAESFDNAVFLKQLKEESQEFLRTLKRPCCKSNAVIFESPMKDKITYYDRYFDILKRLKTYDSPLPFPPAPYFERVLPKMAGSFYDDSDMIRTLSDYMKILVKHSTRFSIQVSKYASLDCIYLELIPDFYDHVSSEREVVACCSDNSQWTSCSGGASLVLKFNQLRLNERVRARAEYNRSEYSRMLQTNGRQPPPVEVCISAVFLEDYITKMIHASKTYKYSVDHIRFLGKKLFYFVLSHLNETIQSYPPTCQLFSSMIELLGTEFMTTSNDDAVELTELCVSNPHITGSIAPLIDLRQLTFPQVLRVYDCVIKIYSKHPDTAFVILSKFDIQQWLVKTNPSVQERELLVKTMFTGLVVDAGIWKEKYVIVQATVTNHLKALFSYRYPEIIKDVIEWLIQLSEAGTLPVHVWHILFNQKDSHWTVQNPQKADKKENLGFSSVENRLSIEQIVELTHFLSNYFCQRRLAKGLYGLYPLYRDYITPISMLLKIVAELCMTLKLREPRRNHFDSINEVWLLVQELYSPWILPYDNKTIQESCSQWIQQMINQDDRPLLPWIVSDTELSSTLVEDFTECISFMIKNAPGSRQVLLSVLNFYISYFARPGVKDHILRPIHQKFLSLPWSECRPTMREVEMMNKVAEKYLPANHSFLACIFPQTDWLDWLEQYKKFEPGSLSLGCALLLNLTIRLAKEEAAKESQFWVTHMNACLSLDWALLPSKSLEHSLNWFVMSVDPRVVFCIGQMDSDSELAMDAFSFRVLKKASGFCNTYDTSESQSVKERPVDIDRKRYLFLRAYSKLVTSASSKHKSYLNSHRPYFDMSIQDTLSEIALIAKMESHTEMHLATCLNEIVMLMSNHYIASLTRNAIIDWIKSYVGASLVFYLALFKLSSSTKALPYICAPLLDILLATCFKYDECKWSTLTKNSTMHFDLEELSSFFDICAKDGHYLFLYFLLQKRFHYLCDGGLGTISFLAGMLRNLKPKSSNEEALTLVYSVVLQIIITMYPDGASPNKTEIEKGLKKLTLSFAKILSSHGDEVQSWAILEVLGITKSSSLSPRGRLFSKCLALFIYTQVPVNGPMRIFKSEHGANNVNTNEKLHGAVETIINNLKKFKSDGQYSEYTECIDFVLEFANNSSYTLSDNVYFIRELSNHLYLEKFLFSVDL